MAQDKANKEIDERLRALRTIYRRANNLDLLPAVVGDISGNVNDPAFPGNVYVRVQTSNGLSDKRSVRVSSQLQTYLKPGLSVLMGYDQQNRLQIIGINNDGLLAGGTNPLSYQTQQTSSGTVQGDIETLRLVPTSPPSLTVCLKSWRDVVGATEYDFLGLPVDLTSYLPSAGNMLYAVIGVRDDYLTGEVQVSTERSIIDTPLDLADRNEAIALLTAGTNPVYAVKLVSTQTAITETDIRQDGVDLRRMVNGSPTYINEYRIASVTTVLGASAPTLTTRAIGASGGVKAPVLQFSKTTQNDCYFEIHAPNDLVNEHSVYFHVMAFPGAAWTAGNFVLKLEYLIKNEYTGTTDTGTPTTIDYDYTPSAATEFVELEFTDAIDFNQEETLICHFYRDVASDNGDDVLSVRFFEIKYTARTN